MAIENLTASIIPMVTQLSALVFGFIRHKKVNELDKPTYISYFDPVVEYYKVDYQAIKQQEEEKFRIKN